MNRFSFLVFSFLVVPERRKVFTGRSWSKVCSFIKDVEIFIFVDSIGAVNCFVEMHITNKNTLTIVNNNKLKMLNPE